MTVDDSSADDLRAEINVTPLVDVMLVLLVIFMVVTPLLEQQLPVELPTTRTSTEAHESDQVHLTAAADGTLRLNGQAVASDQLVAALQSLYATRNERVIFLEADRNLPYATVVDLMDLCREGGVERIGIITRNATAANASG